MPPLATFGLPARSSWLHSSQGNPNMSRPTAFQRANSAGRQWLRTTATNRSPGTSENERLAVYTTQLDDGNLFYAIGVAPNSEFADYDATHQNPCDCHRDGQCLAGLRKIENNTRPWFWYVVSSVNSDLPEISGHGFTSHGSTYWLWLPAAK